MIEGKLLVAKPKAATRALCFSAVLLCSAPSAFATGPVALADFNGDGLPDLVHSSHSGCEDAHLRPFMHVGAHVRAGRGDGTFSVPIFTAMVPYGGRCPVATGDLNGDGIPDFALAYGMDSVSAEFGRVAVYFSDGAGGFTAGPVINVLEWPSAIAIADLNGDGHADLVIGHEVDSRVSVILGQGGGAFSPGVFYPAGLAASGVAVADFNGDGVPDIAAAVNQTAFAGNFGFVALLFGRGDGTFAAPQPLAFGNFPGWVAVGDLDGDGNADLVACSASTGQVLARYGDGTGGFSNLQPIATVQNAFRVLVRDLSGDGRPEILISTTQLANPGQIGVYSARNLGFRSFAGAEAVWGPFSGFAGVPAYVAVTDVNADSRPDVVIGDGRFPIMDQPTTQGIVTALNATRFPFRRSDFDGELKADILWRNAQTGENYLYPMNGRAIRAGEGFLRTVADLGWQVVGTGDFDGDGKADILWRHAGTGQNYIYLMNGTLIAGEGFIRTVADQNWRVAGVGDFDGDGKADILWRHVVTGENYLYPMDGVTIKPSEGFLRTVADPTWEVKGVADFDGDGKADILWRNSATGQNYLYPMDGITIKPAEGFLRSVADLSWKIAGIGDFDGDGKADIVWRNGASGENYLYPMNGTAVKPNEGFLRTVADLNWHIAAVGDYDGDGRSDILWRHSGTGQNYIYPMDGTTIKPSEGFIRTVPVGQGWEVVGR